MSSNAFFWILLLSEHLIVLCQLLQIDEDRYLVSEKSARMYNSVSDAHEKCKEYDKSLKDLAKEAQILSREKEAVEKQKTEAIKKRAKLELDNKDLDDKIRGNVRAKVHWQLASLYLLAFEVLCLIY